MSHYSGKYSGGSSYYSRSRDSDRGRDREKDWGREWRRNERDRSRERDKDRQRSPSRDTRYSDYNRDRRQQYYASDDHGSRYSKFSGSGKYGGKYNHRGHSSTSAYSSTTTLIREKDLPNRSQDFAHGYDGNHYGSYHYSGHDNYSELPNSQETHEKKSTVKERDPKDDPQFKAALDTCIANMKTRGDYDQIRKECLSDIDTKAAFINLHARIKTTVDKFLGNQVFTKDYDKVKSREQMRKKILDTPYFEKGIESVVNQILLPKIATLIRPKIEEEVYKYLNIDKSNEDTVTSPAPHQSGIKPDVTEIIGTVDLKSQQEKPVNPLLSKVISFSEGAGNTSSSLPVNAESQNYFFKGDEGAQGLTKEFDTKTSSDSSRRTPETEHSDSTPIYQESFEDQAGQRQGESDTELLGQNSPYQGTYCDIQPRTPPGVPPPPPISFSHVPPPAVTSSPLLSCGLPDMSVPPPFIPSNTNSYVQHTSHYPPPMHGHGMMDQRLAMPPLPPSTSIPLPPLPPLPPTTNDLPPPPPSPTDQMPLNEPMDVSMIPRPPSPPDEPEQYPDSDDEPLPPGEEPESYYEQLKQSRPSPVKTAVVKATLPAAKLGSSESLKSGRDGETDMEIDEDDAEDDSEEESPMFEKFGEVSPPRVVVLQNSDLVKELSKDLLSVNAGSGDVDEANNPKADAYFEDKFAGESECKYLEATPMYDYKVSYYKRIPDS